MSSLSIPSGDTITHLSHKKIKNKIEQFYGKSGQIEAFYEDR